MVQRDKAFGTMSFVGKFTPLGCTERQSTERQNRENRRKSKTRCRTGYVYGARKGGRAKVLFHGMGIARAKGRVGPMNIARNICRFCHLNGNATASAWSSPGKLPANA